MKNEVDKLRHIALELRDQGKYEDAKKCYDRMLELEPDNPGSLKMAALNLRDMKRYDDAMRLLEKCLAVHPQKHHPWMAMAFIYEKRAEDIYRESVTFIMSTSLHAWREWNDIKFYYEMAIRCMEKASAELPTSWGILHYIERYYAFIRNYEKAIEYREKAQKLYLRRKK